MDYQSSEVDILFNFRTPVDLNPNGTLTFAGDIKTELEVPFSGLYQVIMVKSHFIRGKFTQSLQLMRRPNQNQTAKDELVTQASVRAVDNAIDAQASAATNDDETPFTFGKPGAVSALATQAISTDTASA
jgi:hypothetical protein